LLTEDLIKDRVNLDSKIFVAYSGGPDSSALLHLLARINDTQELNIQAIHINHNLSKKSLMWENHCKQVCAKLKINLTTESIKVASEGGGIESASRRARYKIFENVLEDNDQMLLAHHSDDVAETIFMRMLRGTGIEGIEGPKQERSLGSGKLIRPLLSIPKAEILSFLEKNNINFIKDDSNQDNKFDRNLLRNNIFPLLETRWNGFPNRINNMASIIGERNSNYAKLIYDEYKDLIGNEIEIKKLKEIPISHVGDILRYSIKKSKIALPNTKIMKEIIKTFLDSNPGPKSEVSWSRSDKEEAAGKIIYQKGYLMISKK
jgi:tRNA(Ile)-lysidine synthase